MNNELLALQVHLFTTCLALRSTAAQQLERWRDDDRGEVTATTALIVLLVIAAIAAGGVIATKIRSNAANIPSP